MTRQGDLFVQAFKKWAPATATIIYCESVETPAAALDLLATHIVDGSLGAAVWNKLSAMHSDILATGAEKHLAACQHGRLSASDA